MRRRESGAWRGAPRFLFAVVVGLLCATVALGDGSVEGGDGDSLSNASNFDSSNDEVSEDEDASETVTLDMVKKLSLRDHLLNSAVVLLFVGLARPVLLMYARCLASALPAASGATKIQFTTDSTRSN